jgi:hypothetical protein
MLSLSTIEDASFSAEEEGMEDVLTHRPRGSEDERVLDWRFDALEEAGFNPIAALALAESGVDHHAAANLLARGCPQYTALRILL